MLFSSFRLSRYGSVVPLPLGRVVPRPAGNVVPRLAGNVVPLLTAGSVVPSVAAAPDEDDVPSSHCESSYRSCEQPLVPAIKAPAQKATSTAGKHLAIEIFLIMAE